MKKVLAILLALAMVLSFAACKTTEPAAEATEAPAAEATEAPVAEATEAPAAEGTYEIALVTDVGNIDDQSFNQSTWEGVKMYAEANGKTYNYYRPTEDSDAARVEAMKTAVEKGAKVIVCPGYMFGPSITEAQALYPDVMFLGIDLTTGDMTPTANTTICSYQEEVAGYCAGYAVVMEGYTKLGFCGGMAVPAVVRYGYGFVQGANAAAAELGKTADVSIKFWYANSFAPSDEIKIKMDGWYSDGTEVVFACGGGLFASVVAAADEANPKGWVVGVDVDQGYISERIITSALKDLNNTTADYLTKLYANGGTWPADLAGQYTLLGAATKAVGLPTDGWLFTTFTADQYNALFAKILDGTLVVSNDITVAPTVEIAVEYLS
ncbi:MAG TPA: BMP family ABC transporter substrate-binding protein [Candidatus Cryosericum sp.]|nr:BMP family ABC transporter substrate-binding protein [Candidatus Cryosericum sp.]